MFNRFALIILDGWGHGQEPSASAIAQAHTPVMTELYHNYPNIELLTHGEEVGLPDGQMGNSEVGHLNLGAGRIVYQELARINKAIREGELAQNPKLLQAFAQAAQQGRRLHLMGLVSDGGVHSHLEHLKALCQLATQQGLEEVYVHAFTDGRDTDPKSGKAFLAELLQSIEGSPVQLASVIGRYYAMDRDRRWERVQLAYDLLTQGKGEASSDFLASIQAAYDKGLTDEFMPALVRLNAQGQPLATIQADDVVICFNFRTDRCRQITEVLTQTAIEGMQPLPLHYYTMTRYDERFVGIGVFFEKDNLQNTLGEVLAAAGRTQVRIAETEKYPHVTFFFSGGREQAFEGETRLMVSSPKVATYDLQPEMSAQGITDSILAHLAEQQPDFICLNYANADMVGHTGVFQAAVKAAETVDQCLGRLLPVLAEKGYGAFIVADHGNSDYMINPDGTPNTAHTKNPVPCILFNPQEKTAALQLPLGTRGKLADLAPSILTALGLDIPKEMDGTVLWRFA